MAETGLVQILEGAMLAADKPLTIQNMAALFEDDARPDNAEIRAALNDIAERCEGRGFELQEVASGFRFAVRQELGQWVSRLWTERPTKYSRALLETLVLIAYRQPITRGEIEEIRGVTVSTNIIRTLHEREWIRVVGHREAPGRPAMYATTRDFLDYFNLKRLEELPPLAEIRDFDSLTKELGFEGLTDPAAEGDAAGGDAAGENAAGDGEAADGDAAGEDASEEGVTGEDTAEGDPDTVDQPDETPEDASAKDTAVRSDHG